MQDYDSIVSWGEDGQTINTVSEIPLGSHLKIEFDRTKKVFVLDRVEPSIFPKPANYGFIPQTVDEDNDALDTLIITDEPLPMGIIVRARVIAVLNFIDGGEKDYKIICVPEDDRNQTKSIKNLSDLSDQWKAQVEFHFNHYKDLKQPGTTKVEGWGDAEAAWEVIRSCVERFHK